MKMLLISDEPSLRTLIVTDTTQTGANGENAFNSTLVRIQITFNHTVPNKSYHF